MNKYLNPINYLNYFKKKFREGGLASLNQVKIILIKLGSLKSGKKIQEKVLGYCNSMRGDKPWLYRYSDNCPDTLWASAFAALTLSFIGELQKLSKEEKSSWIKYIQSFQDKKTGFFLDPKFKEEDKKISVHSNELLFAHSSTFIMGALVLLGGKPLYPISWVHEFREPIKMKKWIETRPWEISPWLVGNWSYDMGCAMGMDYLITRDDRNLEGMNTYFEWHDKHQLKETGWWNLGGKASIDEQQYGGYHTLMVYRMFNRPIPMVEKMIESSLSLQSRDGMFTKEDGGGSCQDMDVIDTLVSLGLATGYKQKEIKEALLRALPAILSKQNFDGGFYDSLKGDRAEFGWRLCSAKQGTSDICSTLFQCFSIALIGEFLDDKKIMDTKWHYHETYCHCAKKKIKLK